MTTRSLSSTPTASTTGMILTAFSALRKTGTERKYTPVLSLGTSNHLHLKLLVKFRALVDLSCKRMANLCNYVPIM
jgi:hypothetical protein